MKKRLILAIMLFALPVLLLANCGDTGDGGGGDDGANIGPGNGGGQTEDEQPAVERVMPNLPDRHFDGHNFRVIVRPCWAPHWETICIASEELTGEPINDSVFNRNTILAARHGFELEHLVAEGGVSGFVTRSINAGSDDFDAILTTIQESSTFASRGFLVPFSELKYVDLAKPWWDQSANADMSIGHINFYAMGDIALMANDATWVFFFNKLMAQELDLGNLYEIVNEGNWTLDTLSEFGRAATRDLNGDGVLDHTDQWGFTGAVESSSVFVTSAGERTVSKDADDLPVITMDNPRATAVFDRVFEIMTDETFVILAERHWDVFSYDPWVGVNVNMFREGRALFMGHPLTTIKQLRDMEYDFGILPMPKFNAEQEQYFNVLQYNNATVYSVPVTAPDVERTGFILEAMAAESRYLVTPAYYEVTLQRKHTRDEESGEMLDLIFSTRILDVGFVFNWQNLQGFYSDMVTRRQNTFASAFERIEQRLMADIERTLEAFGLD